MFNERLLKLKKEIKKRYLSAILISNSSNIFYLCGISFFQPTEHEGFLLITSNKNYLITSSLYAEAAQKYLENYELLEITINKSLEDNLKEIFKNSGIKKVGFEENSLSVSEYTKFKKIIPLSPAGGIIESLRQIKDADEIEKIKIACVATDEAFSYITKELKIGTTEIEIVNLLKRFFEKKGMTESFNPIVAFGANSSRPHHVSGKTKLQKNQIVLMDFGIKFEGYCSDFTRTVFFGKADEKFKNMYQAVKTAQEKAFEYLKENTDPSLKEADNIAREYILSKGFPSIPHSLGHGIGIEVHDGLRLSPGSSEKAQDSMVFSLEPGIYIPGFGGVRIEDLVVYKNGPKYITLSNRDLIEI